MAITVACMGMFIHGKLIMVGLQIWVIHRTKLMATETIQPNKTKTCSLMVLEGKKNAEKGIYRPWSSPCHFSVKGLLNITQIILIYDYNSIIWNYKHAKLAPLAK